MEEKEVIRLTAQLERVVTTKDGGGKITFEFGADSLEAIKQIMTAHGTGEVNFAIALVPE